MMPAQVRNGRKTVSEKMDARVSVENMRRTKEIRAVWEEQQQGFPVFLVENPDIFEQVNIRQKKENEALVQEFSGRIQKKIQQKPKNADELKQWEQDFMEFFEREKIISLSKWISPKLLDSMREETEHFIDKVRHFDETLNQAQIWQTLRNYFIYAMIVEMQGEAQNAKNPILAYSLLYPYTDNYIDDKRISTQEKEHYNRMIASKLMGEETIPQNLLEERTCCLLDMILKEYKGEKQKRVAETLLHLLMAQHRSICQQKTNVPEEQILEISIWKGSTSVLADYLFAASEWMEYEERFYLEFGFLLQLVDDLQDILEDRGLGSHTLMTQAAEQQRLEQCVNRLLWFSWNVIREFTPKNPEIKSFVLKNCVEISLLAVAMNQQFFSTEYLKALEPYLPFSLEFLKKRKRQRKFI